MAAETKIALVTGANKGIGYETARQLAAQGITVLLGARDAKKGQEAVEKLKADGATNVQFLPIDVTDEASVAQAAQTVEQQFGRLDILINNAGLMVSADQAAPSQVPVSALRETYEVNVFGLAAVTQAFWPLLNKSEAARLVNVSSILGSLALNADFNSPIASYRLPAYNSSKAAVNLLTTGYAYEWRDTPHKANTIHPGSVETDMNPAGTLDVPTGAKTSVELALIGPDGPNGKFFHLGEELPW